MRRWVAVGAGLSCAVIFAAPIAGAQPSDASDPRAEWQQSFDEARAAVDAAAVRLERAKRTYAEMRHRRHVRGEPKKQIIDELAAAEAELPRAEAALAELLRAARQTGIPPGWIRDAEDSAPRPPASIRARDESE